MEKRRRSQHYDRPVRNQMASANILFVARRLLPPIGFAGITPSGNVQSDRFAPFCLLLGGIFGSLDEKMRNLSAQQVTRATVQAMRAIWRKVLWPCGRGCTVGARFYLGPAREDERGLSGFFALTFLKLVCKLDLGLTNLNSAAEVAAFFSFRRW